MASGPTMAYRFVKPLTSVGCLVNFCRNASLRLCAGSGALVVACWRFCDALHTSGNDEDAAAHAGELHRETAAGGGFTHATLATDKHPF